MFSREIAYGLFLVTILTVFQTVDCTKMWFNPAFDEGKDYRLPKIVFFGQQSRAKRKAGRPFLGWEDVIKKDLKEIGTSWEGINREALNGLGGRKSRRSCIGHRRLGAGMSC